MNKQLALENLSNVTKTFIRISRIKTGLTIFLVGYATIKVIKSLKSNAY